MAEVDDDSVEKLMDKLKHSEDYWNETIKSLANRLNCSAKDVVPLQADSISIRQQLNEQIKQMSYTLYKLMPRIKTFKKQRFEYYAGAQAPYATNATERTKLVEWDLAIHDHKKDILDTHIEFLRESMKVMDVIGYAIKNKVALYQMTDLE